MFRNSLQKRLRMEALEQKIALAADLSVAVVNGDLIITGDDNPNLITIEPAGFDENAQYRIVNRGDFSDTVNGQPFDVFYVSGVTRDVRVDLRGGDDLFRATGFATLDESEDLNIPRDLIVSGGEGNDQFYMGIYENPGPFQGPVNVGRNLTMNGNAGDDLFYGTSIDVGNNFTFNDTQGSTEFFTDPGSMYAFGVNSNVGGNFSVTTGAGTDLIGIEDFVVSGNVSVNVGGGDDFAIIRGATVDGTISVSLGSGFNEGIVEFADAGGVGITGTGTNIVRVTAVTTGAIVIVTGNQDDFIEIFATVADSTLIATFGGADQVEITDSAFDLLVVQLGAGDDSLTLDGVDAFLAILSGGSGTDTLVESDNNDIDIMLDFAFEVFEDVLV
jgi:hypothetical protein